MFSLSGVVHYKYKLVGTVAEGTYIIRYGAKKSVHEKNVILFKESTIFTQSLRNFVKMWYSREPHWVKIVDF